MTGLTSSLWGQVEPDQSGFGDAEFRHPGLHITATALDRGGVELSWAAVANASSYQIFLSDGVFACNLVGETADTSFIDSGLQNGQDYSYIVILVGPEDSGGNLALDTASVALTIHTGDGDVYIDNCELATLTFDLINTGSEPQNNVRISAVRSLSHPGIAIHSINAVALSGLDACSSGAASFDFSAAGLEFGDTVFFEVDVTSDELFPMVKTHTLKLENAESDFQFVASKTYDFETDLEGWQVIQGTFNQTGPPCNGANGSCGFVASSAFSGLQCDQIRSPLMALTPTSTLSIWNDFDTESFDPLSGWHDRAYLDIYEGSSKAPTVVNPDGGRRYNAGGTTIFGGFCTDSEDGWAGSGAAWAESNWSALALGSASLAGKLLHFDIRYSTDEVDHAEGFWFDQVTVTDVELITSDAQFNDFCTGGVAGQADPADKADPVGSAVLAAAAPAGACVNDGDCDDFDFCTGVETCIANACVAGSNPCPGQACDEVANACIGGSQQGQIESGSVSVDGTGMTVNLSNDYVSLVVVTTVQYSNNTRPVVTRISAVTNGLSSSFHVRLQSPSGNTPAADNVSYLVVEAGTWTIDGVKVEAQTYNSTVTDQDDSWVGEVQAYGHSYTTPVVLGQVMSTDDSRWSVFWAKALDRLDPPSASVLWTGKHVGEDTDVTRNPETVGFIVFEAGHGTIGGVNYEAALGADTVQGVGDSPPYTYTFVTPFSNPPSIALTTIGGMDGFHGAWAQVHGATMATNTTLSLSVDEDQIGDAERNHTNEQVGYFVLGTSLIVSACAIDADCADGVFCNGVETCDGTSCQPGTPETCDDAVGCTDDSCNVGTDSCDNVTNDGSCSNGLFCDGEETCHATLDCQDESDPCAGDCDDVADQCVGAGTAAPMESGSVSVDGTGMTVNLTNDYVSLVVVTTVQYSNNTTPVVTRISAVTSGLSSSFHVRLQSPSGNTPAADNVSYLVVEAGTWTIDGVKVEAQTYLSTETDHDDSWVGEVQAYGQGYTTPVVLGQVMSENDSGFSAFWARGATAFDPPSASTLYTGKHVGEDTDVTRANETVGFIVFEAGHGTIGGVEYEAALGADTVFGAGDSPPYTYTFNTPFAGSPSIALGTVAGMDGFNGGWAQVHGATMATTTSLFLSVDEDQILDAERAHTNEQVGYFVLAGPVVVAQP